MTDRRPIIMLDCRTGTAEGDPFGRARQWAAHDGPEWLHNTADAIEAEYGDSVILGLNQPAGKLAGHKVSMEQFWPMDIRRQDAVLDLLRKRCGPTWKLERKLPQRSTAVYVGGRASSFVTLNTDRDHLHLPDAKPSYTNTAIGQFIDNGATHLCFDLVSNRTPMMDQPETTAEDVRKSFFNLAAKMQAQRGITCIGEAIPNEAGKMVDLWVWSLPWMALLSHLTQRDPDNLWDAWGKQLYVGVRPGERRRDNDESFTADDLRARLDRGFVPIIYTTSVDGFSRWAKVLDEYLHKEAA